MRFRHYTPQLPREMVSRLYHEAKSRRVPMTTLAATFINEAFERLEGSRRYPTKSDPVALVAEPVEKSAR